MKKSEGVEWLADCDFLNERFDSIGAAWADAAEYTREISPRMEAQQLRALRMVFYAAASGALKAATEQPQLRAVRSEDGRRLAGFRPCMRAAVYPPADTPGVLARGDAE